LAPKLKKNWRRVKRTMKGACLPLSSSKRPARIPTSEDTSSITLANGKERAYSVQKRAAAKNP
jgi:hypothetical protein